jgi:hypothetical protein
MYARLGLRRRSANSKSASTVKMYYEFHNRLKIKLNYIIDYCVHQNNNFQKKYRLQDIKALDFLALNDLSNNSVKIFHRKRVLKTLFSNTIYSSLISQKLFISMTENLQKNFELKS